MLYFVAACVATSVAFAVLFMLQINPRRTVVTRRLDELEQSRYGPLEQMGRRRRLEQSERLKEILQLWGEKVEQTRGRQRDCPALPDSGRIHESELGRATTGVHGCC